MTLNTRATYIDGVLRPIVKLDLQNGTTVEVQITTDSTLDPKDALMDDAAALQRLYAQVADEDRLLANQGLSHYAATLESEEDRS